MTEYPDVCVVTYPIGTTGVAVEDLLKIITSITSVSLITAGIADESGIPDNCEVVILSESDSGTGIVIPAIRFVINQIRMCNQLRNRDEDVILFFGATSYLLPILFARLLGKSAVLVPRGDVPLSLKVTWERQVPEVLASVLASSVALIEELSYRAATGIVTYTPSMARQLGLDRYDEKLHTNGARFVDTEQFDVRVPFEEREQVVGFIGRLDVEKRVPELAAAARQLPEDIRFVFVGDGDYREMLERELAAEIERGKVEIVGWVDREEVPEQLNRMRLQVLSSHPTEGLPTAILEGMACGTPAYATPVSGVPDVIREGETGFLMCDIDEKTIATEVENILGEEQLDEVSRNTRELIEEEYSFAGAVERWQGILTAVSCIDCSTA
jgi:glycosyltransferase involved in cell wall biosynthesis